MSVATDVEPRAQSSPYAEMRAEAGPWRDPERLILGVRDGVRPGGKPPVRIFLGTEPAQHRAERIFVWSIERVRDPARIYEIYLMKDLAGFRRLGWLTGFTNYRFAVPHFAGGAGRAIYNDVDQVYLRDPGALFDLPMAGHGVLAIAPEGRLDTSVMLIDCARMVAVWRIEEARRRRKNTLIRKARAAGAFGVLAPSWNARDEEYTPGESGLLHFTTLHMQPWRPFPRRFVYQRNPVADVWLEMAREADARRYRLFSFAQPSRSFRAVADRNRGAAGLDPAGIRAVDAALEGLIAQTGARRLLHVGLVTGPAPALAVAERADLDLAHYEPARGARAALPAAPVDGVFCAGGLQALSDADVSWAVAEMFARAERFVYAYVPDHARRPGGSRTQVAPRDRFWWFARFEAAAAGHPAVHWRLDLGTDGGEPYTRRGGRSLDGAPRIWVLDDGKPGHATQSVGLAEALGWPYEVKSLRFNALAGLGNLVLGRAGATLMGVAGGSAAALAPPWPDLVIATGWRPAPVVRWIGERSRGRTRTLQMGRKGGRVAELYDIVVSCRYFRLPFHPRRIETAVPLNRVSPARLADAARRWQGLFGDAPAPRIVALVGGSSRRHAMTTTAARRLGEALRDAARAVGGSVFAVTSRRTGGEATDALAEGLGGRGHVVRWEATSREENPYLGYLALADVLVVTGESESMLSEAAAAGRPVHIYPVAERGPGLWGRIEDRVSARAHARRLNRRGTVRPQRGLDHLCARLIARGIVQPRRDVGLLHRTLLELGIARPFGGPLEPWQTEPLHEAEAVAGQVRALLGLVAPEPGEAISAREERDR